MLLVLRGTKLHMLGIGRLLLKKIIQKPSGIDIRASDATSWQ